MRGSPHKGLAVQGKLLVYQSRGVLKATKLSWWNPWLTDFDLSLRQNLRLREHMSSYAHPGVTSCSYLKAENRSRSIV